MISIRKNIFFILSLLVLPIGAFLFFKQSEKKFNTINSFAECVQAGYQVTPTYPEECAIPGKKFFNPNQKEIKTYSQNEVDPAHKKVIGRTFLIDGNEYVLSDTSDASTSTLQKITFSNTYLEHDLNNDNKQDLLLIAEKQLPSLKKNYYILFSVGLYEGTAPANGIFIGENISNITLTPPQSSSTDLLVTFVKENKKEEKLLFYTVNDILKKH